jgi:hypothetical protein
MVRSDSRSFWALLLIGSSALAAATSATVAAAEMPRIEKSANGWQFFVDGKPFLMFGGQVNNSSGWASTLPDIWKTVDAIHANTVEIPVYWENVEARRGEYDFGEVDKIVASAREHDKRVVLLWFASWKNGASNYVPQWVKRDRAHFPTMIDAAGQWTGVISPYFRSTLEADCKAFVALMEHLKQVDGSLHTVIMVQVENESGSLGTPRDYSPEANKLFEGAVPEKLLAALHKKAGSWSQVFGPNAEEAFAAWGISSYINEIAAAGKKAYALPMYVNCWLAGNPDFQRPGEDYPSGGPEPGVLDLWKAMAPAIDAIGPDNYQESRQHFREALAAYRRPDNAMFIPETNFEDPAAQRLFEAVGEFGAIGFSPFGLDATGWTDTAPATVADLAESYRLLGPMVGELSEWQAAGKLHSVVQDYRMDFELLHLDQYDVLVQFSRPNWGFDPGDPKVTNGRVLIAELGPAEFVVTGFNARVSFRARRGLPAPGQRRPGDGGRFFLVEDGSYTGGHWAPKRLLNGDQTDFGLNLPKGGAVYRALLEKY